MLLMPPPLLLLLVLFLLLPLALFAAAARRIANSFPSARMLEAVLNDPLPLLPFLAAEFRRAASI